MFQQPMHPGLSIGLATEIRIKGRQASLSEATDEALIGLYTNGKKQFKDKKIHWMDSADQPEEFYEGIAAGRVLIKRHGSTYINNLRKACD